MLEVAPLFSQSPSGRSRLKVRVRRPEGRSGLCRGARSRAEPHVAACGGCIGLTVGDGVEYFTGAVVEGQASAVVAELDAGSVEGDCEYTAGVDAGGDGGGAVVVVDQCPSGQRVGGGGQVGEDDNLVARVGTGGVDQGVGDVDVGVGGYRVRSWVSDELVERAGGGCRCA